MLETFFDSTGLRGRASNSSIADLLVVLSWLRGLEEGDGGRDRAARVGGYELTRDQTLDVGITAGTLVLGELADVGAGNFFRIALDGYFENRAFTGGQTLQPVIAQRFAGRQRL